MATGKTLPLMFLTAEQLHCQWTAVDIIDQSTRRAGLPLRTSSCSPPGGNWQDGSGEVQEQAAQDNELVSSYCHGLFVVDRLGVRVPRCVRARAHTRVIDQSRASS
jgi:hypothetical protein